LEQQNKKHARTLRSVSNVTCNVGGGDKGRKKMGKPKAQTIQQRFGFGDTDLKTPKHDEIMLWLDDNVEYLCRKITNTDQVGWSFKHKDEITEKYFTEVAKCRDYIAEYFRDSWTTEEKKWAENIQQINKCVLPSPNSHIEYFWEKPIKDKSYIIGFVDMMAIVSMPQYMYVQSSNMYSSYTKCIPTVRTENKKITIFFEVKTAIPSLGELIRQIQMYKSYINVSYNFYVIAPDDKFAPQLKSQNIGFIKYPTDENYLPKHKKSGE
jgi:hypothetical protein